MAELVTIAVENGIADVRLNRPEKYNALSPEMFQAITNAGEQLADRKDVRVVVLSGNGRGFCAGLDMSSFQGMADRQKSGDQSEDTSVAAVLLEKKDFPENMAQRPAMVWKRLPMPVIAALHGVAFGGGCQIALGADIRFAAPDLKMSVMEIKWGLIPDMSITQTLRDLVPIDVAKELTFTGRILSGEDAKTIGLVTHVTEDPLQEAMKLAAEIASKSPDAIRFGKKLYEESWHADARTGLEMEAALQSTLIGSENQKEAVMANFENRSANFK